MRNVMLALFIALLLLVLGGLYLAFPAGVTSVRFVVVLALGVLGVITYIIYERVRRCIEALDDIRTRLGTAMGLYGNPPAPPPTGQPPEF